MVTARTEPEPDGPAPGPRTTKMELDIASVAYVAGALLVASAVLAIFRSAPSSLTKVAVGILLAAALEPLVARARRTFRWSRTSAVALVAAALASAFAAIALLLAPPAIRQAQQLTTELPQTVESTYSWPLIGERLAAIEAADEVERLIADLPGRIDDATIGAAAEAALGGVQTLTLVLITAVAVMIDGETLLARARRLISPARRVRADEVGRIVYRTVGNYFAGSLLVASMNGLVILTVGLVLGVPLAPLAAIWATLTNLIPQIGGLLGGSFFVVLALTEGPVVGLIALGVFLLYQQVENNVIQPAVVGKAVNLLPPTTMLAALIGGSAAGVPGALAATPLVGTVKAIYLELRTGPPEEVVQPDQQPLGGRQGSRHLRRRPSAPDDTE
ncbi:MAG: AI-2E family transporter [Acidimicrobiales bacterium]